MYGSSAGDTILIVFAPTGNELGGRQNRFKAKFRSVDLAGLLIDTEEGSLRFYPWHKISYVEKDNK